MFGDNSTYTILFLSNPDLYHWYGYISRNPYPWYKSGFDGISMVKSRVIPNHAEIYRDIQDIGISRDIFKQKRISYLKKIVDRDNPNSYNYLMGYSNKTWGYLGICRFLQFSSTYPCTTSGPGFWARST